MKVKYYQSLHYIKDHYESIFEHFEDRRYGVYLLKSWGIYLEDRPKLEQELDFIDYMVSLQEGFSLRKDLSKPSIEVANRCLNRYLDFLDVIHNCNETNYETCPNPITQKEYMACKHYLFQFSLNGWYKRLPDKIKTHQNNFSTS